MACVPLAFGGETRQASLTLHEPVKVHQYGDDKTCREHSDVDISFTFPVEGGEITDFKFKIDIGIFITTDYTVSCLVSRDRGELLSGYFTGGDGGHVNLKIKVTDLADNTTEIIDAVGVLYAKGEGWIAGSNEEDEVKHRLNFAPFGMCNPDLNAYSEKARSVILTMALNEAAKHTYQLYESAMTEIWKGFVSNVHLWEYATDNYTYRTPMLAGRLPPKNFYEKIADNFIPDAPGSLPALPMLDTLVSNIGTAFTLIQAADSALDGDYATASLKLAIEGIGLYSNGLGLLVAAGEAVKADWDAFAKRAYEKQYREFYEKLYYQGGPAPTDAAARKTRKQRLRLFMEEAMDYLTAGGVGGASDCAAPGVAAAQFRKMIIDYAHYKLEMELSRCDFATDEYRGKTRLRNKHLMPVFAALYRDFEKTYRDDLHTLKMKQIALEQAKLLEKSAKNTRTMLAYAVNNDFTKVWPEKSMHDGVMCKIIGQVRKEMGDKGLMKPQ
jgi:hypothetical protein